MLQSLPHLSGQFTTSGAWLRLAVPLGLAFVLCGCASAPPDPNAAIGAANQAIQTADRGGVSDASAPELVEARTRIAAANAAVATDHPLQADRLAREARVDAELASARSQVNKAQAVNDEIRQGTATLSNEVQRNSGAQP